MRIRNIKRIFVVTALATAAFINTSAQDLIARQAPVDRKVKTAESVIIQEILEDKATETSAAAATTGGGLYEDWTNAYVTKVNAKMPDDFVIDLRGFHMPTPSRAITSNFGPRWGRQHKGLDIKVYIGDTLRSAWPGVVRIVKYDANGYGNYVVIRHPNGLETVYGHMSKHLCKENQVVKAGDVIGLGGNTGRSTGSHLHFETRLCGVALNPALFFDFRNQDVTGDTYHYRSSTYEREQLEATRLRGVQGKGTYTPSMVKGAETPKPTAQPQIIETADTKQQTKEQQAVAPAAKDNQAVSINSGITDDNEPVYTKVKEGETLTEIARRKNVTLDQIYRLNPELKKNSTIKPNQDIRIS